MCTPSQPYAGGRSGPAILGRKAIERPTRAGPVLAWRGRTARRTSGRPTGPPPPRSGARHPSGTECWLGVTPQRRGGWGCPAPASPVPIEACRNGGSLPATARNADRHRRSAGRGATASAPAMYSAEAIVRPNGDFLSGHPQSEPDTQDLPPTSTSGGHLEASRQPYRVVMAHVAVTTIYMYNRSMEFEWDEAKNQTNIRKHGIGFDTAKRIFEGTVATSPRPSPGLRRGAPHQHRPGRARSADRGDPTERRGRIRLISARPASRKERRVYHERTLR